MILQLASSDREKARTTMGHRVRQRESELEPEGEREGGRESFGWESWKCHLCPIRPQLPGGRVLLGGISKTA